MAKPKRQSEPLKGLAANSYIFGVANFHRSTLGKIRRGQTAMA